MQVIMAERLGIPRLIERAKQGDRGAFDELVTCSQGDLAAFIQRRIRPELRNQLDAQALTNDTLARAFESLERFTGHDVDSWFAWLAGTRGAIPRRTWTVSAVLARHTSL